jgi:hypothetical protein
MGITYEANLYVIICVFFVQNITKFLSLKLWQFFLSIAGELWPRYGDFRDKGWNEGIRRGCGASFRRRSHFLVSTSKVSLVDGSAGECVKEVR